MKGFTRQHIKTGKEKGHREPHEKRLRMNKELMKIFPSKATFVQSARTQRPVMLVFIGKLSLSTLR